MFVATNWCLARQLPSLGDGNIRHLQTIASNLLAQACYSYVNLTCLPVDMVIGCDDSCWCLGLHLAALYVLLLTIHYQYRSNINSHVWLHQLLDAVINPMIQGIVNYIVMHAVDNEQLCYHMTHDDSAVIASIRYGYNCAL